MKEGGLDTGVVAAQWWRDTFARNDGAARKARAVLRRAAAPIDVLVVPETHVLNRRWQDQGHRSSPGQLAAVVTALARVKRNGKRPIAVVFGEHVDGGTRPRLSPLRFDSLVRVESHDELTSRLRRVMACIGEAPVSVEHLARDVFLWSSTVAGRWCYQYFGETSSSEEELPADASTETAT